jgi:hypothetical protein
MSLRREWKFQYPCSQLQEVARTKKEHHVERLNWWETQQKGVMKEVRAKGLEVREQEISGGRRGEIVIDPTYQRRLNECCSKIEEHRELTTEYTTWERVFELNPSATVDLDAEDIQYFGL